MKYNCKIVSIEDETITIEVENCYITGFANSGITKSIGDKTTVEILLYDDLEICKSNIKNRNIVRQGKSLSYSLYGILDVSSCSLKSSIDFEIDKEELYNYSYLDGEWVKIDVVRIDFVFV